MYNKLTYGVADRRTLSVAQVQEKTLWSIKAENSPPIRLTLGFRSPQTLDVLHNVLIILVVLGK